MEDFINQLQGNNLSAEEINSIANEAQKKFGLSNEAKDDLMFLLLTTGCKFQEWIFNKTYRKNV